MKPRHLLYLAMTAFVGVVLSGAADAAAITRSEETPTMAQPACAMPNGWSQVAERNPKFIIFGENHGTQEAPAFVGDVACALAAQRKSLLVAVEHDSIQNAAFQAAWHLPSPQFEAALWAAGWQGRDDGVASEAMFRLLVRLHTLKDEGGSIGIVAFNGAHDDAQRARFKALPGQGGHEAAQAENIRNAALANRYDYVLVLTGNLHARKQTVERGGFTFKPMAMMLAPADQIVSLNMQAANGTSWNCILKPGHEPQPGKPITSDAIECGVHTYTSQVELRRRPFISLHPVAGIEPDSAYDGIYWVGAVHGSKPAVPKR